MTQTTNDVSPAPAKTTMVVKLQYKASKRLAEVDLTVESVRKTLDAYFGEAAAKGPLFFSLSAADDELLSLETD